MSYIYKNKPKQTSKAILSNPIINDQVKTNKLTSVIDDIEGLSKKNYNSTKTHTLAKDKSEDSIKRVINTEFENVTELNKLIQSTLTTTFDENITVVGELSNFKITGKNLFATLKDIESCINIVCWGFGYKKHEEYKNGEIVKVIGKIAVYTKSGSYCLAISKIEAIGSAGDYYTQYEELKQKYDNLGYFQNKKPELTQISRIGIVTSLEGAALQDILYVLKKNNFKGIIVIKGCIAQGDKSSGTIVKGIQYLEKWRNKNNDKLDVILITRGGGSFEDLVSFSSADVIEAIHICPIFTISAVGHEIDFMLSDFVADYRAPTPSVSAEYLCKINNSIYDEMNEINSYIENNMLFCLKNKLESYTGVINSLRGKITDPVSKLNENIRFVEKLQINIDNKMSLYLNKLNEKIKLLKNDLSKYDVSHHMDAGYAIILKNNSMIDSVKDINKSGQKLKIKMRDGEIDVIVQ
ncbi:MAG: exodeoxyribonuclease VII large subunit [Terrestrivirus sp.]|uniref:Exodeoxyribonuclease VII large subunit n=1 Tax=Terrestrivirus sp. TaxID=2487775 RepID=A0A3G4ZNP4_9VIRU|nr:MAG: exodeoxyribonuclease VII large subunit [Terrestrivirus sp.]